MKSIYTIVLLSFFFSVNIQAQTFVKKADFPGGIRWQGQQFTIGDKVYVTGGVDTSIFLQDVWEYNTVTDAWTKKNDLPAVIAVGTSTELNGFGYVGLGWDSSKSLADWWQYDNSNDTWTKKADFPGTARFDASAFSWNNEVYILGGSDYDTGTVSWIPYKDMWKYAPLTNTWTFVDTFIAAARHGGFAVVSGNFLYTGLGTDEQLEQWYSDIYSYDLENHIWKNLAPIPFTPSVPGGSSSYVGMYDNKIVLMNTDWNFDEPTDYDNIYVYDINKDEWTIYPNANVIPWRLWGYYGNAGGKGYTGIGYDYEFDIWYTDNWEINLAKVVTSVENQHPEYDNIKVSSTTRNIHIELPEQLWDHSSIVLKTIDGKLIKNLPLGNQTEVDLSSFIQGAYAWSILNSGNIIKSGKVIRM